MAVGIFRPVLIWGVIAFVLVVLLAYLQRPDPDADARLIAYSALLDRIEAGDVSEAITRGDLMIAVTRTGERFASTVPQGAMPLTVTALREAHAIIRAEPAHAPPSIADALLGLSPMLLLLGAWYFFMRQMKREARNKDGRGSQLG